MADFAFILLKKIIVYGGGWKIISSLEIYFCKCVHGRFKILCYYKINIRTIKENIMSKENNAKKHGVLRVILTVAASLIALVLLVLLGVRCYFRLPVAGYYKNSEKTFVIPGLSDGMTHQGLAYDRDDGFFYITGYRSDGEASQVSIVNRETGDEIKRLSLANEDSSPFLGHVGGITLSGDYVYVADSKGLAVFLKSDFDSAGDGDKVASIGTFETASSDDSMKVAFVHAEGDRIFLGEFYREENYPTPDSHKVTCSNGSVNPSLILEYRLNPNCEFGISNEIIRGYSVPGLVQGMCLTDDGKMCLSTSYGPAFSHILIYSVSDPDGSIDVLGQKTELSILDSASLVCDIKAAPMSEEIVLVDGKLHTMCESATNKYVFGKFTSAEYCYATDLSEYLD